MPVFRFHTTGDGVILPSAVAGYERLLAASGHRPLYRASFVRAAGHCTFSPAEIAAAIDLTVRRVTTGAWDDTSPATLNRRAAALDPAGHARYVEHVQEPFHRVWTPDWAALAAGRR